MYSTFFIFCFFLFPLTSIKAGNVTGTKKIADGKVFFILFFYFIFIIWEGVKMVDKYSIKKYVISVRDRGIACT